MNSVLHDVEAQELIEDKSPARTTETSCRQDQQPPINQGLPSLNITDKPISFFEFWPAWLFYLPVVVYWLLLSLRYRSFGLPMAVNPQIPMGGMVGESKYDILQQAGNVARPYILPYVLREAPSRDVLHNCDDSLRAHIDNDLQALHAEGIVFPCVIKPEFGCRGAGVQVVHSQDDLSAYLRVFPADRRYIIQQLAPYVAEVGVFYERMPGAERGRVTSITLKYRPVVVGNGRQNVKSLILGDARASLLRVLYFEKNTERLLQVPAAGEEVALAFAGSHCRGSIFRNGNDYLSEALSHKIDDIMQDFPEFYYGRLDIKFKDIASLQAGEDFCIIEVNGVSSEKTHIWDSRTSLLHAFATLLEQYGTLFKMGHIMRTRGGKVPSVRQLIACWWSELRSVRRYPSTD